MSDLTPRELKLVALGAALGSNCVSCVEYHIAESRRAGLADTEIHAASSTQTGSGRSRRARRCTLH